MSITITDPELAARLAAATPGTELLAADGRVLGRLDTAVEGDLPPGVESPFSLEELARRRANPGTSRPLADIIRDLQARK